MMLKTIVLALCAFFPVSALAAEISGTALYRERIAMPPDAAFRAVLYEIADGARIEIGRSEAGGRSGPPYAFTILYDADALRSDAMYRLEADVIRSDTRFVSAAAEAETSPAAFSGVSLVMTQGGAGAPVQISAGAEVPTGGETFFAGVMTFSGDDAVLEDCRSAARYPIGKDGAFPALEAAYLADSAAQDGAVYVEFDGRIGASGDPSSIEVTRVLRTRPGITCERQRADAALVNTYWRLDLLQGEAMPWVDGAREAHILLDLTGGYRATVGCNRIAGSYTTDEDTLRFGPGRMTMMACPEPLDRAERRLVDVLTATERFDIAAETLVLRDAEGVPLGILTAVYF